MIEIIVLFPALLQYTVVFFIITLSLKTYEKPKHYNNKINFTDNVSLRFLKINKSYFYTCSYCC